MVENNDVSRETVLKIFLPRGQFIDSCVTTNMKVIENQSEPSPSYFPKELWGKSSVTTPIIVSFQG